MVQLSHLYMTTGKTIALTIQTFVEKVMSLLFNMMVYDLYYVEVYSFYVGFLVSSYFKWVLNFVESFLYIY